MAARRSRSVRLNKSSLNDWRQSVHDMRQALFDIKSALNEITETGNYPEMQRLTDPLLNHQGNGRWYFLVFKPFDWGYNLKMDWYMSPKWMDYVRKLFPLESVIILTTEKNETKHHVNALVFSEHDLSTMHDKNISNKCKVYATVVNPGEQFNVRNYIFKEARTRVFMRYHDYYTFEEPSSGEAVRPCAQHEPAT